MLSNLTKSTDRRLIWRPKCHNNNNNNAEINIVMIGIILFIRFSTIQLKLSRNKEVKYIKTVFFVFRLFINNCHRWYES